MGQLNTTENFEMAHGALAAKLAGLAPSLFTDGPVMLADAGEGARGAIAVARHPLPGLTCDEQGCRVLSYADPVAEASLAALVACIGEAGGPVAADPESLSVLALAERLAQTDIPVLVGGPTGTGKEVLSRFIHDRSTRRSGPFIAVNCAAIPETMLEAMLFGHRKGAFTGASEAGEGFFRAADGGTLLLDEIAEMPLSLQAKLLRALQEGEVVPVGATKPIKVDVRIVAAANRELAQEVEQGRFREDLFYRLNVFPISLRPLRERPADIAPLAFALLMRHAPDPDHVPWISDVALAMLRMHGWPGNVRELENVIRRALVLSSGAREIGPDHIAFDQAARAVEPGMAADGSAKLSKVVLLSEAKAIMQTLDACGGKRAEAAKRLGISERTLRYRLASFREAGIAIGGGRL
ncbi:MAG: sigma 54-interacting transcriptional regulator [Sphingomonadaceae bacterium]|nr:sigma 54-interacting transcriptional regulator [Sphingomonadaceae bacterium]